MLISIFEKEIRKLLNAKIIVTLIFSKWVANLVPIRKKNAEIQLCIDFIIINKVSLKDNYPFPKMEHILQKVVGSGRISTMDGFLGQKRCYLRIKRRLSSLHHGVLLCMLRFLLV